MKFSTRSLYGVRAMVELAMNYGNGPILVKEIAKNQEISKRYLEHLIVSLQAAGLVKTIRGKKGGCLLAKPPHKIRIGEIVEALEGKISPVDCVDNEKVCSRSQICASREVWSKVKESIINTLNSITLEEMVKLQEQKSKNILKTHMYYI